jgi:hypothetical protein
MDEAESYVIAYMSFATAHRARGEQLVPLRLRQLDLIKQRFEPIEFAADLGLEMRRQATAVARRQLVEPLAPVAAQRLVTADPLGKQQPLDAVDVLDPLSDQRLALAADAAAILICELAPKQAPITMRRTPLRLRKNLTSARAPARRNLGPLFITTF